MQVGQVMPRPNPLERLGRLSPRRFCGTWIPERPPNLPELAEHLRVQQPIFRPLRFVYGDPECGDALVEGTSLTLDGRFAFEGAGRRQMISPALGLFQRARAELLGKLELPESNSRLGKIERDDAFDDRVTAFDRDSKSALQAFQSSAEVSKLGMEHPYVVEHPRNCFQITGFLERVKTVCVRCGRSGKITAHIR